ncbi:MAG: hypothetical protein KJ558_05545 [Gammaproteobacteria bacterium]|nr:hypothetical protein [Gammaproteobacteria bacterium]MBU1654280.1 hypothetical protein [Gammaproteobacteria bacterium]MBU1960637.1 hypothetical protein [Gammaproteobacteria bacterium]
MNTDSVKLPVETYKLIRIAVGLMGISLPFAIYWVDKIFGAGNPPSISASYYSPAGVLFIGIVSAIGMFMLAYTGERRDDKWYNIWVVKAAGFLALLVVLFPTHCPDGIEGFKCSCLPESPCMFGHAENNWVTMVHGGSAALFFIFSALASAFLHSDENVPVYALFIGYLAGVLIAILVLFIVIASFNPVDDQPDFIYKLETVVLVLFGVSWLVWGGAVEYLLQRLRT